jgi:hypothetical protein
VKDIHEVVAGLSRPFRGADLEWRIQRAGLKKNSDEPWAIVVPYVTARAIFDRLDEVVGPENWQTDLRPSGPMGAKGTAGMIGGIAIRIEGEWVWKWDAAQATDIEAVKGAASGSIKRAAVQWRMGRDLYGVGDLYAKIWAKDDRSAPKNAHYSKSKVKRGGQEVYVEFKWLPPELPGAAPQPKQAAPAGEPRQGAAPTSPSQRPGVKALEQAQAMATERYGGPTKAQAQLFARIMRSSVWEVKERNKEALWLAESSSQENIGREIDRITAEAKKRKAAKGAA